MTTIKTLRRLIGTPSFIPNFLRFSGAVGLVLAVGGATPGIAAAALAPRFQLATDAQPADLTPISANGEDSYRIVLTNVGDAPTDSAEPLTIADTLPAGVTATRVDFYSKAQVGGFLPSGDFGSTLCTTSPLRCTYPGSSGRPSLPSGEELFMIVTLAVNRKEGSVLTNKVAVSGGGAPEATATSTATVSKSPAPFGVHGLELSDLAADGAPSTQAGAHPFALTTTIPLNDEFFEKLTNGNEDRAVYAPTEDSREIHTELPAGFIGNPRAVPRCSLPKYENRECPVDTQIGDTADSGPD